MPLATNNVNPLATQARHRKPTEFHVDDCTTWHSTITTAASRPGPTIDHPAENTAFKINATIEYCTKIVTMAQAIGTATSIKLEAGSVYRKLGFSSTGSMQTPKVRTVSQYRMKLNATPSTP